MKNIILTTLLSISFITVQINASDSKQITAEELIAQITKNEQLVKNAREKTEDMKEETKAIKKLGKTLDKVLHTLEQ